MPLKLESLAAKKDSLLLPKSSIEFQVSEQWYWPDAFYNALSGYLSILMNQQIHVGC